MSIELYCKCDECGAKIIEGEAAICDGCWSNRGKEIVMLYNKIDVLEEKLAQKEKQ